MDAGYGSPDTAVALIRTARRSGGAVLLEGVHALKHALRFGASIELACTPEPDTVLALFAALAPDLHAEVAPLLVTLEAEAWDRAVPRALPSPVVAVARRPVVGPADVLAADGPVVVLEQPRHLGNVGAVIRVAAAADAGGVLVVGDADPWHPTVVRGAAGLQFALPVARADVLPATDRPLIALDGDGDPTGSLPADGLLLVGTERGGIGPELAARATASMALPMRSGVSSLNLATAVAVALYRGR
jgi:RNA methyltransferase, TrmH family